MKVELKKASSGAFFVWIVLAALLAHLAFTPVARAANDLPNILLVIADDAGLDASPCYDVGARKPKMAFLERMCAKGVVFENAYAAPSCSPTRATILTGRYGFRTGVGAALGPNSPDGLSPDETSLFQFLDDHAPVEYANAVIGKWHLATHGNGWLDHPALAGVRYYAGVISGTIDDYYRWPQTHDGEIRDVDTYITTTLTDEAIDWVRGQNQPWFLWLAHVAPHTPFHDPPAELLQSSEPASDRLGQYLAALEALDSELGRFVNSISQEEQDNLVVIFLGDNGSPGQAVQEPFSRRRAKGSLHEGGVRVPLVVWGKGVTRRGKREAALVNSTDLFATIAELAGIGRTDANVWPEDSISFAPLLSGSQFKPRDTIYVEHFSSRGGSQGRGSQIGWAIRDARYKLLHDEEAGDMFFDLETDPWEENDLLSSSASTVGEAAIAYERLSERGKALRGN